MWDLGGQPRFRNLWERYCRGVQAIVYVVDSADLDGLEVRGAKRGVARAGGSCPEAGGRGSVAGSVCLCLRETCCGGRWRSQVETGNSPLRSMCCCRGPHRARDMCWRGMCDEQQLYT